jgi:hypothetical protein
MTLRPWLRQALAPLLAVAFFLGLPSRAHAQIAILQEQSLPRLDANGNTVTKRPQTLKPEGVNYRDCVDDQRIRFPLQLSNFEGNASLQVWAGLAGADCKEQQNRNAGTAVCWQVSAGIQLALNPVVDIPVRAIMAGAPPNKPSAPVSDASICGKIDLTTISLQFLYFSPGQLATSSHHKVVAIEVDTVGPPPPSGLKVLPGNGRLKVSWDNISGEGGLSGGTGVKVYCEKVTGAPSQATTDASAGTCEPDAASTSADAAAAMTTDGGSLSDAASIDAASTDAASTDAASTDAASTSGVCDASASSSSNAGASCQASKLIAGQIPDKTVLAEHLCGEIAGNTGSSVYADTLGGNPLENGVTYAVAVAGTDPFDNPGTLSTPLCNFPEVTANFWEDYRDAGGDAGGGCAITRTPVGQVSALVALVFATLATIRRRLEARAATRRIDR